MSSTKLADRPDHEISQRHPADCTHWYIWVNREVYHGTVDPECPAYASRAKSPNVSSTSWITCERVVLSCMVWCQQWSTESLVK
jgi:hypothetical protein